MKRSYLKRKSDKTHARDQELSDLVAIFKLYFVRCEAGPIRLKGDPHDGEKLPCVYWLDDVHHIEPRSAEPSRVLDPTNFLGVCRPCHTWIDAEMGKAKKLGLIHNPGGRAALGLKPFQP